jgi:putative glutamine amidotransferase
VKKANARPLVVVTGPHKKLRFAWWGTRLMLWLSGLRGHYVTPANADYPPNVRGVVIGGGDNIDPEHYGALGDAGAEHDSARDALELQIFRQAFANDLPILGICRGSQLMNIALGGNLHQDLRRLRQATPNKNSIFPIKDALLQPGSEFLRIFGQDTIQINSLHNQANNQIAEPFQAVAKDRDGFVQAIENPRHPFMVGVQWHPEYMPYSSSQRRLFSAFSDAVKASDKTLRYTGDE